MSMAENRRGLGRGLSALLGDVEDEVPVEAGEGGEAAAPAARPPATGYRDAPIELLHPAPPPSRAPPRHDGQYEIVAGERRWRASQRAGLHTVPVIVRELDDLQVMEIAIVENVQRLDLSAIGEAP